MNGPGWVEHSKQMFWDIMESRVYLTQVTYQQPALVIAVGLMIMEIFIYWVETMIPMVVINSVIYGNISPLTQQWTWLQGPEYWDTIGTFGSYCIYAPKIINQLQELNKYVLSKRKDFGFFPVYVSETKFT